jgi:hypothetical protein
MTYQDLAWRTNFDTPESVKMIGKIDFVDTDFQVVAIKRKLLVNILQLTNTLD